jgi:hypothetical protein
MLTSLWKMALHNIVIPKTKKERHTFNLECNSYSNIRKTVFDNLFTDILSKT